MAIYRFRMPDIGEGVAEAEIVAWRVEQGQEIEEDEPLVDVMTDKATVEITAPVTGTIVALHGKAGDMRAVGSVLVEFEVEGEDPAGEKARPDARSVPGEASPPGIAAHEAKSGTRGNDAATPLAAPATRRRAARLGIPLDEVEGTGPGGRITPENLQHHVDRGGRADPDPTVATLGPGVTETRLVGLRRAIAERMEHSALRIPHITYVEEIDMTALEDLRREANASLDERQTRLTILPFIARALALVLPSFPQINAHYDDQAGMLRQFEALHLGIATQTPSGLVVTVLRHAQSRDLWACAAEIERLAQVARQGKAVREELSGSTLTVTSLGPLGGVATTPIINGPEVAIIGPNRIVERPVVRDGGIAVRKMMNLSCSFDHRIVDGHDAATFVQALRRLLEQPALIFLEKRRL